MIVGVNEFVTRRRSSRSRSSRSATTPSETQRERLAQMRADARQRAGRAAARRAARRGRAKTENIIPAMLDCARAYCTLYEIRQCSRRCIGAYREPVFF